MDAVMLQLFSAEEILDRLAQKRLTGCFHAFTPRESAFLSFKEGVIVAAVKEEKNGQAEGEEVLKQILAWTDARYLWKPNTEPPLPAKVPLQIDFHEFAAKHKLNPQAGGKASSTSTMPKVAQAPQTRAPVIPIGSKGKATGPIDAPEATTPRASLSPTKTLTFTAEEILANEESLLHRFKLALVAQEDKQQRHPITRVSSLVGRSPACEIIISHPSISRQHCLLQITERGLLVKDMGTTNGTKVNGIMLKEGYINVGDKLTVGHLIFVVEKV